MSEITPASLPDVIEEDGIVRVLDITLAQQLGYDRPRNIRALIKRHRAMLEEMGGLLHREANPGPTGGRRAIAFYLNEAQAHFIVAKSETERANIELAYVAQVFTQFRRGNLIARDAETQAALDEAEAARLAKLAKHIEEKEARYSALRFINQGSRRRRRAA